MADMVTWMHNTPVGTLQAPPEALAYMNRESYWHIKLVPVDPGNVTETLTCHVIHPSIHRDLLPVAPHAHGAILGAAQQHPSAVPNIVHCPSMPR